MSYIKVHEKSNAMWAGIICGTAAISSATALLNRSKIAEYFYQENVRYPYIALRHGVKWPVNDFYYYGMSIPLKGKYRVWQKQSIRHIQRALGLEETGVFNAETDTAVREFQKRNHLVVNGAVGDAVAVKLGLKVQSY